MRFERQQLPSARELEIDLPDVLFPALSRCIVRANSNFTDCQRFLVSYSRRTPLILTPASRRLRATVAAISGAPGVSPLMHSVCAFTVTSVPSQAITVPRSAMLNACCAACAGSRSSLGQLASTQAAGWAAPACAPKGVIARPNIRLEPVEVRATLKSANVTPRRADQHREGAIVRLRGR